MDTEILLQFFTLIILLTLSSFFSSSETALMSLSKIRVRYMMDEGIKNAYYINKLIENPSKMLSTILIGNNIANIGASALATSIAINLWGNTGVGIATGIMTVLVIIFGEITPKSLAAENSERVALRVAKPIYALTLILNPLIKVLMYLTNIFLKLLGVKNTDNLPSITEEELKSMVNVSQEEGVLEVEEKEMIYNVFQFGDSQIKDVMVPRTDMISADVTSSYDELITMLKNEQFSRIPIYEDSYDNIIGILYVKDLMFADVKTDNFNIKDYMREPYFTYEFKNTSDLFAEMRKEKIHISIVLDEYGGTAGIVTIEDLIEEIVGEIEDEYDKEEREIQKIKDNEYLVYGKTKISDVNEVFGTEIQCRNFDSIGGFIIDTLGKIPEKGEEIKYENITILIEEVNKNRIEKIRVFL